jgi:hypothetical protein
MFRKLVSASLTLATAVSLQVANAPAGSAAAGGGCNVQGTATLTPGLNSSAQNFSYSFSGALSSCKSSDSSAPVSGSIGAGQLYQAVTSSGPDPNNPTVTITHTEHFYEPIATGNGRCANSTTSGVAFVTWDPPDNTVTIVSYKTTGALAAVALQGSVIDSIALSAPDHLYTWEPTSLSVATTRYSGFSANAALAFQPPDPTACNTPTGVTSAGISGAAALTDS